MTTLKTGAFAIGMALAATGAWAGEKPLIDLSPDQKLARAYALCHRPYRTSTTSGSTSVLAPRERVDPHLAMPCQAIDRAWEVVTPTQDDISAARDFIFEVARDLK
jgi:hypothetical protein